MIIELLKEYKDITISIIDGINNEEYALMLIEKREEILEKLFAPENSREIIKKAYLDLNLMALDKELKERIDRERILVKEEIRNLHNIKNANNAYEKNRKINNFFSTKI